MQLCAKTNIFACRPSGERVELDSSNIRFPCLNYCLLFKDVSSNFESFALLADMHVMVFYCKWRS